MFSTVWERDRGSSWTLGCFLMDFPITLIASKKVSQISSWAWLMSSAKAQTSLRKSFSSFLNRWVKGHDYPISHLSFRELNFIGQRCSEAVGIGRYMSRNYSDYLG